MKLEVKVVSKETIKPCSPTPAHSRFYQLSFLDQISPPVYNPLVIFYSGETDNACRSNRLKSSLSEVLTRFYPLAGRFQENICIDCNDEGIPFVETRASCQLSEVVKDPDPRELKKLLPFQLDDVNELVLGVQFNIFDCGGVAIGVCISHKIADALSFFTFIKAWASTAREDEGGLICPDFNSSELFPPRDISGFQPSVGITKESVVVKRFVFNSRKIEALRAKYAENLSFHPTRVEALSAFIWSRFMKSSQDELGTGRKLYTVIHAVNLRTRFDPPLPETSFGNLYRVAVAIPPLNSSEEYCYDIVKHVREEVSKIDKNYVNNIRDGTGHLNFLKKNSEVFLRGNMVSFSFTSLCRFPLYESDFGWGKPTWVGSVALTFKNLVVFMDNRTGAGIEAYIHLLKEDMARLEGDQEFLAYTSPKEC